MLKIKHEYGGRKGEVIRSILSKADKNTAWASFLLNNYDSYLETLNIFNTKEVTRFKKHGADSYVGGTQFQLNKHIEKTFAEEDFVACVCLLNEYIRRRYGVEHIEYIDE